MIKESYFNDVFKAIKKFYLNDGELLARITHEQTISFRIAKYLSESLEKGLFSVDCEFHGNLDENGDRRKEIPRNESSNDKEKKKIRPDIIFHQRSNKDCVGINLFLVEVKKESPNGDIEKARKAMKELNYHQAFCLSNVGKNYVTLYEINPCKKIVKHRYKVLAKETGIILEEVKQ